MCTTASCKAVLFWALLLIRFCTASPPTSTSTATATATTTQEDEDSEISLWDTINRNPNYAKLTACLQAADPSIATALRESQQHPLTLFAPTDAAFDEPGWGCAAGTLFECKCSDLTSATRLTSYHVSTTTARTPYIGEKFATLLGDEYSARFYGITKSADVPVSLFPIQFVDAANVTAAPVVVQGRSGNSFLYPLDRVLRTPLGTIWETLSSDESFSLLTAALNGTKLARSLDTADGLAFYTFFAPDNDAVRASPAGLPEDIAELEVLLSFHTVATGVYPQSLAGAHFSQQLFRVDPADGSLGRDFYRDFYADSFVDGQVTSLAGPLLNITRLPGTAPSGAASPTAPTSCRTVRDDERGEDRGDRSLKATARVSPSRVVEDNDGDADDAGNDNSSGDFSTDLKDFADSTGVRNTDPTVDSGDASHRSSSSIFLESPSESSSEPSGPPPLPSLFAREPWRSSPSRSSDHRKSATPPCTTPPPSSSLPRPEHYVEGISMSEMDISATNGVLHRLSAGVMAPPANVAGVLLDPPFPLVPEVRGGVAAGEEERGGFDAIGELLHLAWPLVNRTLTEDGPLTVLAPTDAAFELAIAAGNLPARPWWNASSLPSTPSSTTPLPMTPDRAARLLLSHTLRTPEGPLLFSPTALDPFNSDFVDGTRFSTAVGDVLAPDGGTGAMGTEGGGVEVGVKVVERDTRSTTAGAAEVTDREVFVDGGRVSQCVDGSGVGHDCGSKPRPSNTYALNGAHLCVVHAIDRVLFPADPQTDLATLLDQIPSLSNFAALLKEWGTFPNSRRRYSSGRQSSESGASGTSSGRGEKLSGRVGAARVQDGGSGSGGGGDAEAEFFTVFAPTNDALERLKTDRPWLFQNSSSVASSSDLDEESEWSPRRELLAYHLVPGGPLFSRYLNESSQQLSTLALGGMAPLAATFSDNDTRHHYYDDLSTNDEHKQFSNVETAHSTRQHPIQTLPAADKAAAAVPAGQTKQYSGLGNDFVEQKRTEALRANADKSRTSAGTLRVNLQTCSQTDLSASNGVLHILDYVDHDGAKRFAGESSSQNFDSEANADAAGNERDQSDPIGNFNGGDRNGDGGRGGREVNRAKMERPAAAGVIVPDVLELTFALGFRKTYNAIVSLEAEEDVDEEVGDGAEWSVVQPRDRPPSPQAMGGVEDMAAAVAAAAGRGAIGVRIPGSSGVGKQGNSSVADALRGAEAHSLLVVQDSRAGNVSTGIAGNSVSEATWADERGLSEQTLRYQTVVGGDPFAFAGKPSAVLQTLLGRNAHAFNNSENPRNPYSPSAERGSDSGLYVDQAQVILPEGERGGIQALNGRIFEISEPLQEPAPDLFALLSGHPDLRGWADWVQLTGLAELFADPTAGPFTVFAPTDDALERIPGRTAIEDDRDGLEALVRFHTAVGVVDVVAIPRVQDEADMTEDKAGDGGLRYFTPSLANATERERALLAGDRFVSGRSLDTLLQDVNGGASAAISVQIALASSGDAAVATTPGVGRNRVCEEDGAANGRAGAGAKARALQVFVGPVKKGFFVDHDDLNVSRRRGAAETTTTREEGVTGGNLHFLGAFSSSVVLPNLNAVNGVVHGISSIMTHPGYKRPPPKPSGG